MTCYLAKGVILHSAGKDPKKYVGKGLYIAFMDDDDVFVYPHDEMAQRIDNAGRINESASWSQHRSYSWPSPPTWLHNLLKEFKVK